MTDAERLAQVKTKIVVTLGPVSQSAEMIRQFALAGADVFRLNLAHGTQEGHEAVVERIRAVSEQLDRPLAVLADLAGPKIRLGELPGGEVQCEPGARVELAADHAAGLQGNGASLPVPTAAAPDVSCPGRLTTNYPPLVEALQAGDLLLLADGAVSLRVVEMLPGVALCRVEQPGTVRSRQGINAPGVRLNLPAVTAQDRQSLRWAGRLVDFVGLSFVSGPADVAELRRELEACGSDAQVIAKIERAEALGHLDSIVEAADAVMVARGDLGVEIDVALVPGVQKQIIRLCNERRVPVITATQMLDSMRLNSRPTRAEASDVANAILDGSDALMLSGETAVGQYPLEAVRTMSRIALETERLLRRAAGRRVSCGAEATPAAADSPSSSRAEGRGGGEQRPNRGVAAVTEAVVEGASRVAERLEASMVIVATHSGQTALRMSKQRNFTPTLATSDLEPTLRRMCLYWGVTPLRAAQIRDSEHVLRYVVDWGRRHDLLRSGDRVVLVASTHWTPTGHNMILVHEVA